MAGVLQMLIPKRTYDFSSIDVGESQEIIVAEELDISQYIDGILIVRVHSISAPGGSFQLQLVQDGHTRRDPTVQFRAAPSQYFHAPLTIDSSLSPGTVVANGGSLGKFLGEYAMLVLTATRTADLALIATISADLLMRTPDDVDSVVESAVKVAGGCRCD